MSCQLLADCLNEIFEYLYLEKEITTLHSCLLVSRLWCEVSARILWRDIWNKYSVAYQNRLKVGSAILSTLIACLPNESKDFLHKNEIFISTPTSSPPLFNYAAFCKVLSIHDITLIIDGALSLKDRNYLVTKEIFKMFMNQISSLKILTYYTYLNTYNLNIQNNITFTSFPGARGCLTDLSELRCTTDIHSEFFYQLSQICHNLQSLTIKFQSYASNELMELVSSQNNLKDLGLISYGGYDWVDIIPALTKHSDTLTRLLLSGNNDLLPLSFVSLFSNLQEFKFTFLDGVYFEDFEKLQDINFPKLKILKFPYQCPRPEYVLKFLEINGKNLRELHIDENNHAYVLNSSISKFCPNLKKLFVIFHSDELDKLKNIFDGCQYLESIEIWCGGCYLSEKEVLEVVAKYSPKNFYELKIFNDSHSELVPEDLESFFIRWENRRIKKSFDLIIIKGHYNSLEVNEENMKVIEKYKNLWIINKFEAREAEYDELMTIT